MTGKTKELPNQSEHCRLTGRYFEPCIADMLSRAYLQVDRAHCKRTPEYQIFKLKQEQQLFEEIASINQVDYMRLSEGTHQHIK